jgi:hypothetical protein
MARRPRNVLPKRGVYHVTCRGVERRPIFASRAEYTA